jgi:hypothetical protein
VKGVGCRIYALDFRVSVQVEGLVVTELGFRV